LLLSCPSEIERKTKLVGATNQDYFGADYPIIEKAKPEKTEALPSMRLGMKKTPQGKNRPDFFDLRSIIHAAFLGIGLGRKTLDHR
jgi:hypothetical protein